MRLRHFLIAPLLGLCACATENASHAELSALREELKVSRENQARLERRLEALETQRLMHEQVQAAGSFHGTPAEHGRDEMPALTVVKLRPKYEAPPKLDLSTMIIEPSPEQLDQIQSSAPLPDADEDPAVVQADYERSLRDIRTGNVDGGAAKLDEFAASHPKHPQADNALYYSGIAHMGLEDFEGAAERFERIVQRYPAGDAVADAKQKLAECRTRLSRRASRGDVAVRNISPLGGQ